MTSPNPSGSMPNPFDNPYTQPQPDQTDQPGQTSQTGQPQPGAYTQSGPYAQPGAYQQPQPDQSQQNPYAQSGPYAQPQPGQPLPQGMPAYGYGQAYGQGYGQPYGQPFTIGEPPLNQPWYGIGFIPAVQRFFLKYATFSGRASRGEFWWAVLFLVLAGWVLDMITGFMPTMVQYIAAAIWALATIVPYVAVAVRRLHDTNKSGWWVLLPGIPYVISEVLSLVILQHVNGMTSMFMDIDPGNQTALQAAMQEFMRMAMPALTVTVCSLFFLISGIVLMTARTNPAGVRFDAAAQAPAQAAPQQ